MSHDKPLVKPWLSASADIGIQLALEFIGPREMMALSQDYLLTWLRDPVTGNAWENLLLDQDTLVQHASAALLVWVTTQRRHRFGVWYAAETDYQRCLVRHGRADVLSTSVLYLADDGRKLEWYRLVARHPAAHTPAMRRLGLRLGYSMDVMDAIHFFGCATEDTVDRWWPVWFKPEDSPSKLEAFDPQSVNDNRILLLFGKRGSGKTIIEEDIMGHIAHRFDHAYGFSPSSSSLQMMRRRMPECNIPDDRRLFLSDVAHQVCQAPNRSGQMKAAVDQAVQNLSVKRLQTLLMAVSPRQRPTMTLLTAVAHTGDPAKMELLMNSWYVAEYWQRLGSLRTLQVAAFDAPDLTLFRQLVIGLDKTQPQRLPLAWLCVSPSLKLGQRLLKQIPHMRTPPSAEHIEVLASCLDIRHCDTWPTQVLSRLTNTRATWETLQRLRATQSNHPKRLALPFAVYAAAFASVDTLCALEADYQAQTGYKYTIHFDGLVRVLLDLPCRPRVLTAEHLQWLYRRALHKFRYLPPLTDWWHWCTPEAVALAVERGVPCTIELLRDFCKAGELKYLQAVWPVLKLSCQAAFARSYVGFAQGRWDPRCLNIYMWLRSVVPLEVGACPRDADPKPRSPVFRPGPRDDVLTSVGQQVPPV